MRAWFASCISAVFFLLGCAGCSVVPNVSEVDRWAGSMGGVVEGPRADRLRAATRGLVERSIRRGSLYVLDCAAPGAYAWPGGRIYVTGGLMELMGDDELTAAVAHELGHLLAGRDGRPPASVQGPAPESSADEEGRADVIGVRLLREARVDPAAMGRMLAKLGASASLPEATRRAIGRRIDRLGGRGGR